MLAATHPPARRLHRLSPFEAERQSGTVAVQGRGAAPDYGCVEWFQYVAHAPAPLAVAAGRPSRGRGMRRP